MPKLICDLVKKILKIIKSKNKITTGEHPCARACKQHVSHHTWSLCASLHACTSAYVTSCLCMHIPPMRLQRVPLSHVHVLSHITTTHMLPTAHLSHDASPACCPIAAVVVYHLLSVAACTASLATVWYANMLPRGAHTLSPFRYLKSSSPLFPPIFPIFFFFSIWRKEKGETERERK